MSNYTVVRLTKVQPYMHTVGSSYAALANVDGFYGPTLEAGLLDFHGNTSHATHANLTGDSVLVLIGEDTYSYRSTSTIVLMVTAWILLILGFVFCCCAECCGVSVWRGKKRASVNDVNRMEAGAADGDGGGGGGGRGTAAETNAGECCKFLVRTEAKLSFGAISLHTSRQACKLIGPQWGRSGRCRGGR